VAVVVDDHPATINGTIDFVAGPNGAATTFAVAAAVLVLVVATGLLGARRGGVFLAVVAVLLAAAEVLQVRGQWVASTDTLGSRVGAAVYGVLAIVAAAVIAVTGARRGTERGAPALLLSGIALAVCGGFARITWLAHSQLPTTLQPDFARATVAAHVAVGVACAVVGAVAAARRPTTVAAGPEIDGSEIDDPEIDDTGLDGSVLDG
jgi:hypothetical protein